MPNLIEIEGIGLLAIKQLVKQGIKSTQALLARGYSRKGRKELSKATGLSEKQILEMVAKADILQIHGIGPEYADLLNSVGVDTPEELASHDPNKLADRIEKANQKKKLVRKLPARDQVKAWILGAIAIRSAPHGLSGEAVIDAPPPRKTKASATSAPHRKKKKKLYLVRY